MQSILLLISTTLMLISNYVSSSREQLSPTNEAAVFKAAGYTFNSRQWRSACNDPGTPS